MSSPLLLERTVRIHEALERAGFAHAIGGALALGYHVEEPRATRDIHLKVSAAPARPQLLFDALAPGILCKALFSRQKDWVDIEALLRFGMVDEAQALRWLSDVVGSDDERITRLTALVQEVQRPAKEVPVAAVLFRRRKPRLGE